MNLSEKVNIDSFILKDANIPIVDVRSPGEFEHAHIPGAYNIPLFTNDERAIVGTIYKNSGKEHAVMKGLEIVGPKMVNLVKEAKKVAFNNKIYIHCWRGGMRSESMAWLFETNGIKCSIIEDGYKAYRRFIKSEMAKRASFLILGGMTGSGKTKILQALKNQGEQIIDLEHLAHHKGSAFGGIGQETQPTTEQFENNLFDIWQNLDKNKTIWLEDESKAVGGVKIPDEIFLKMRQSPVIELRLEKHYRIQELVTEYAELNANELKSAILRIQKKLGGQNTKACLESIDNKDYAIAVNHALKYYDRAYLKGLAARQPDTIYPLELEGTNVLKNSKNVISFARLKGLLAD